ncbi:MAG TPA: hypothetical protein VM581_01160 [Magnetospirillaceae bacterium]|nr:hypothetical protein [Magnetospirillaceae bacterium]
MRDTVTFGIVIGGIQASLTLLAIILAGLGSYWVAATLTSGGVVAAGVNLHHFMYEQHDAPMYFFISLMSMMGLFLVCMVCGFVDHVRKFGPVDANTMYVSPLPIAPQHLPPRDRLARTLLMSVVKSHRAT